VRDLKRSMEFFSKLGFEYQSQFTDEKAACMIINEDAYVMLAASYAISAAQKSPVAMPNGILHFVEQSP
jgi:predicted lactoylglutathione lyase